MQADDQNFSNQLVITIGLLTSAVIIGAFWLPELSNSFWVDETITYWITSAAWNDIFERTTIARGPGCLYYCAVYFWVEFFGNSEISLRIPSLLATMATALLLYRFSSKKWSLDIGVFAAIAFLSNPIVSGTALDARPYAFVMLCCTLCIVFANHWIASRQITHLALAAVCLIALGYLHILTAPVVIVLACLLWSKMSWAKRDLVLLLAALLIVFACCYPLLADVLVASEHRLNLFFAPTPSWPMLLFTALHFELLVPFAISLFVVLLLMKTPLHLPSALKSLFARQNLWMPCWMVIGPICLFVFSTFGQTSVFVSRYYAWSVPGAVLCLCCLLASFKKPITRTCLISVYCLMAVALSTQTDTSNKEDWRSAINHLNQLHISPRQLTLLYSGVSQLEHSNLADYRNSEALLLAPTASYPVDGSVLSLPQVLADDFGDRYWTNVVQPKIKNVDQLALLGLQSTVIAKYENYSYESFDFLSTRLEQAGFTKEHQNNFARVSVATFRRAN